MKNGINLTRFAKTTDVSIYGLALRLFRGEGAVVAVYFLQIIKNEDMEKKISFGLSQACNLVSDALN